MNGLGTLLRSEAVSHSGICALPHTAKTATPRLQSSRGVASSVDEFSSHGLDCPTRRLAAELDDVLSGRALGALDHVELHGLALGEGLEAVTLDGGVMHEAILLAVRGGDEAEALGVVEPLHGAGRTHS